MAAIAAVTLAQLLESSDPLEACTNQIDSAGSCVASLSDEQPDPTSAACQPTRHREVEGEGKAYQSENLQGETDVSSE
jgi:hypothetical protein